MPTQTAGVAAPSSREEDAVPAARQALYLLLALATSDPRSGRWPRLKAASLRDGARLAAELLVAEVAGALSGSAPGELPPRYLDVAALLDFLDRMPREEICEAHDRVFGLMVSKECPPYETEYLPQTFSVTRSHHLADVAGFYRAFGVEPSRDRPERHDHVSLELEFMTWLIAKERRAADLGGAPGGERAAICREAQVRFFAEHLAWWLPAFALALRRKAEGEDGGPTPARTFYGALGTVLAAFTGVERALLGVAPPTELVGPRAAAVPAPENDEGCAGCSQAGPGKI